MFVKGSLVSVYANNGSLDEKYTRGDPFETYTSPRVGMNRAHCEPMGIRILYPWLNEGTLGD